MATYLSLEGIALVTGAASGIGRETALSFAEAGSRGIVLADVNLKRALEAAEESRKVARSSDFKALAVEVDVTDESSVESMVHTTLAEFHRIDYFVNSAGMGNLSGATTSNIKKDLFSRTLDVNVTGLMLCLRAVSKAMVAQEPSTYQSRRFGKRDLGRGTIVNLASSTAHMAAPGMMAYTASKHAVFGITKTAALDLMPSSIRVNCVCPSYVDTPMMQASLQRVPQLDAMIKKMSPLKRAATPDEVVDYVLFLCSPGASYINGTGLVIDAAATLSVARI